MWNKIFILTLFAMSLMFAPSSVANATQFFSAKVITDYHFEIEIKDEVFPEIKEIIGRKYDTTVSIENVGYFVTSDGTLIAPAEQNLIEIQKKAIEQIEKKVISDIAEIKHVKEFGQSADENEKNAFEKFYKSKYKSLKEQFEENPEKFEIAKKNQQNRVFFLDNVAEVKKTSMTDQLQIIETKNNDSPSIEFKKNQTLEVGNVVYVLENTSRTSAIVEKINGTQISLDKNSTAGALVENENGEIIGLFLENSKKFQSSLELNKKLSELGIKNKEAAIVTKYKDALGQFSRGEYIKAKQGFDEILAKYPNFEDALEKSRESEKQLTLLERIIGLGPLFFVVGGIFLIGVWAVFFRGKTDKRR